MYVFLVPPAPTKHRSVPTAHPHCYKPQSERLNSTPTLFNFFPLYVLKYKTALCYDTIGPIFRLASA